MNATRRNRRYANNTNNNMPTNSRNNRRRRNVSTVTIQSPICSITPKGPMVAQTSGSSISRRRRRANRTSRGMPRITMSGSDIIGVVNVGPSTLPGKLLFSRAISPKALDDTRLRQISKLYSRWRPLRLQITVVGSGSANTFGSVAVGWMPDSNTVLAGTDSSNIQRAMACRPSRMVRLNQTGSLNIPSETNRKWYVVQGPSDDSDHGQVAVVCSATTGGYTGSTTFTLQLNWTAEFEGAELDAVESDEFIYPDVGYSDLFTTSDASWNDYVLTLKMHHGGSMVPFSSAHPGKVYRPAVGTKVQYYLEDKTTLKTAEWFAVVQGYATPGFVMFASRADAVTYIQTGDTNKCLKYYTQGPVASPSRPAFQISESDSLSRSEREQYESRIKELTALFAQVEPINKVTDSNVNAIKKKVNKMPDGTSLSPFKVLVEDPGIRQHQQDPTDDFEVV
ncbi:structural protein precursor [Vespa velutina associated permutotetra-like virus 1]|nr:structural protein precursor [Vespa velutina associated permutotetra-like virus 1]